VPKVLEYLDISNKATIYKLC